MPDDITTMIDNCLAQDFDSPSDVEKWKSELTMTASNIPASSLHLKINGDIELPQGYADALSFLESLKPQYKNDWEKDIFRYFKGPFSEKMIKVTIKNKPSIEVFSQDKHIFETPFELSCDDLQYLYIEVPFIELPLRKTVLTKKYVPETTRPKVIGRTGIFGTSVGLVNGYKELAATPAHYKPINIDADSLSSMAKTIRKYVGCGFAGIMCISGDITAVNGKKYQIKTFYYP
ncbi:MAG: hypothetical protein V1802_01150 [Candidatus Aenigmatarchaeota archaeon]